MRLVTKQGSIELVSAVQPQDGVLSVNDLLQNGLTHHQAGRVQEAERAYQAILNQQPQHPDALHLLGLIAHEVGKNEIAVQLIEKAISVHPTAAEFHNNCGEAYRALHRNDWALERFKGALAINPESVEAHNNIGNLLEEQGKLEEAIVYYEKALAIRPDCVEVYINLGITLLELGHEKEAVACYERALTVKPDSAEAHRHLSMLKPGPDRVSTIEGLLAKPGITDVESMNYHFALGNIFDQARSYPKAFEHFRTANSLKRKMLNWDPRAHSDLVDQLIAVYSATYFAEKAAWGSGSELPVFIVGMPRSGTTLVEQIAASHPSVHGADELLSMGGILKTVIQQHKATSPYPECMTLINKSDVGRLSAAYLHDIKGHSADALRITDKMPGNFLIIGLIKTLFPRARIIYCKRNALDTCTSIYLKYFTKGHEYAYDLNELGRYYLDGARIMNHWITLFPSEILTVQYEELVLNQERLSREMIEFLGLEWNESCLNYHENQRAVRTQSNLQVRKPLYRNSIDRWKLYEEQLQPLVAIFGKST